METNYRDDYYGSILDPIHGNIKLSEIEKWCIAQPIFSRLRRVKQNTFLYYVFPSAIHTRFEHSIGVMHLAGQIFDACKENYATGVKKLVKYKKVEESSFFNLNKLGDQEKVYYQELRLAALLHDLGHGPLSHLFDEFSISKDKFMALVNSDDVLKNYSKGFGSLIKEDKVEHEIISCAFIFILLNELIKDCKQYPEKFSESSKELIANISPERVVKLIEPDFLGLAEFNDKGINYTKFFSRIITAFPIDADRMDYLLRDSYFSGVTYGIYDINRIFTSFLAADPGRDGNILLTFKESGLDSMLRFIQSRSHLYNQVYFHKTNRAANTMLSYGTKQNSGKIKLLDKSKDIKELIGFYIVNGDENFLFNTVPHEISNPGDEQDVIVELINRKLFKRVFQHKVVLSEPEFGEIAKIKEVQKEIDYKLSALKGHDIFAISDRFENNTYKDSTSKPVLIANKIDKSYQFSADWKNVGREFQFANMNVSMIRIYIRRNFNNSSDFEGKKKSVLDTVKQEIELLKRYKS